MGEHYTPLVFNAPNMKLTVKQVDSSKPKEKDYKLFDGGGLYLLVTKSGSKYWRLKYRIDGKEKVLAIQYLSGFEALVKMNKNYKMNAIDLKW
ncbi:Putative prophage CPS-53 integrase [Proteus vulgaris]|nr:Putative prophage CPS-53 integrase [Proteus vulgaris]